MRTFNTVQVGEVLSKRGFRIYNRQRRKVRHQKKGRFLNFVKIPHILRKIFKNLTIDRESLLLKVGEFTCMLTSTEYLDLKILFTDEINCFK